jgi:hypothetical protein
MELVRTARPSQTKITISNSTAPIEGIPLSLKYITQTTAGSGDIKP